MDVGSFSLGLFVGMLAGIALMSVGFYWMLQRAKDGKALMPKNAKGSFIAGLAVLTVIGGMLLHPMVILAQDDTPVPLVIPINAIFTQANNWLSTLSPIASLGIGIIIALAVFGFLSKAIKSAFG